MTIIDEKFIFNNKENKIIDFFEIKVESPSNIALVKYWGKRDKQIPSNPSISFTLDKCKTITEIKFSKKKNHTSEVKLFFENNRNEKFENKIKKFIDDIKLYSSFILDYDIIINTKNTFPHSSGIASSASGISALAVGFVALENQIAKIDEDFFIKKTSFLARIGSGSASRSIKGNIMLWGKTELVEESSDLYSINLNFKVHEIFSNFKDTILIIDREAKEISSTLGHGLMNNHPFSKSRFIQANNNLKSILESLKTGNLELFGNVLENEALTLHSMMMTSSPWVILIKPNTLKAIDLIKIFRSKNNLPLYFTLDAGANIHLLYPDNIKNIVSSFIENELKILCLDGEYIDDNVGNGFKIIIESLI